MDYIALLKKQDGCYKIQTIEEHINGTATLASTFASKFLNKEWGRLPGLCHYSGKFSKEISNNINCNTG
jgi:CRISPR-associated endonuclease/helicase Cas3